MKRIILYLKTGFIMMGMTGIFLSLNGQVAGEYRSAGSGQWDSPQNWEWYDDNGWFPAEDFPNGPDKYVTIRQGHEIIYRETNAQVRDLQIEQGGKLFSNGAGSYWYLVVFGNITCDGVIGNHDTTDGLCLKPEGDSCLILGAGDCRFRRIRKDSDSVGHTRLIIGMDLEVYYDGTGDAVYNNCPGTILELEILPLSGLTLHSSLDLQDGILHIRSDSTGNGSLICTDVQHDDSTNVFLDLSIVNNNHWHFIGSPVGNQPIQPEFVPDPLNNAFDFYKWDEGVAEDSGWINIRNASGGLNTSFETHFAVGRGYLVSYSSIFNGNQVRTFSGPVTTGNVSIPLGYTNNYWNLVSNPYPCGLNWQSDGIYKMNIAGMAMYIWDQELNLGLGGYRVSGLFLVPSNTMPPIVPPMNGFFVKAISAGSIDITPDSANTLVHPGIPLYKGACADEELCLRIGVTSGEYSDEVVIAMVAGATAGYDSLFDAEKLFRMHDSIPEIAVITDENRKLCIDVLEFIPARRPLYLLSPGVHPMCITGSGMEHFPADIEIYLVDSLTGDQINLREQPSYTFTASTGAIDDRFCILLENAVGAVELNSREQVVQIRCHNGEVIIDNISGKRGSITFTDVLGRVLQVNPLTGEERQRITAPSHHSILLVTATWNHGQATSKIMNLSNN